MSDDIDDLQDPRYHMSLCLVWLIIVITPSNEHTSTSTSSTALEQDDEVQSSTNMSTRAWPRALEHEHGMHSSTSTSIRAQALGGQANSASRQQNFKRHAQPVGHFLDLYVGLHGPGWRYMIGMPPRGDLQL